MEKLRKTEDREISVLGEDTEFSGTMKYRKVVHINGRYTGKIIAESVLVISENAHVEADVKVNVLILAGTLKGEVEAKEKVDILPTGKLYGNIITAKLKIADGVVFDGTCKMIKSGPGGE